MVPSKPGFVVKVLFEDVIARLPLPQPISLFKTGRIILSLLNQPQVPLCWVRLFMKGSLYPWRKRLSAKLTGPVVLHICGNTDSILSLMCTPAPPASALRNRPI